MDLIITTKLTNKADIEASKNLHLCSEERMIEIIDLATSDMTKIEIVRDSIAVSIESSKDTKYEQIEYDEKFILGTAKRVTKKDLIMLFKHTARCLRVK